MAHRPCFNYIITVHNKETLLDAVLTGVAACAGPDARIVVVLDGCTDGSEAIARSFAVAREIETRVVTAPDVHEIKSINIGLRETKPGYCVIVQDDVVLQEPLLEQLVHGLCEDQGRQVGYISFRLAADVRPAGVLRRFRSVRCLGREGLLPIVEECNFIGGPDEHLSVPRCAYGQFHGRMVGIKSPVCLTPELRAYEGYLDEHLAPYCYDDVDMSLRALKRGLRNGLFPIRFRSDLEWGSTRKDPTFSGDNGAKIRRRNRRLIWQKHGEYINSVTGVSDKIRGLI